MVRSFTNAAEKYGLDGVLMDVGTELLAGACGACGACGAECAHAVESQQLQSKQYGKRCKGGKDLDYIATKDN